MHDSSPRGHGERDDRPIMEWPESSVDIDDDDFAAAIAAGRRERTAA